MSWWHPPLLGLLQGVTEFLPISSSGHLALAQLMIPGFAQPGVVFDAMLHLGTASAVLWFERRLLLRLLTSSEGRRLIAMLVVGTCATATVAFPLRYPAEAAFGRASWVGLCLLITGALVMGTRFLAGGQRGERDAAWAQAVAIGLVQGLAVFPGISRSGATIAAGLASGLDRAWAARFSFLLSVPAIAGATAVELISERTAVSSAGAGFAAACIVGALAAGLSGYAALRVVIAAVSSRLFHHFAWYCLALGLVVLVVSWGMGR